MRVIAIEQENTHVSDFDTGDVIAIDNPDLVNKKMDKKYYMLVSTGAFGEETDDGHRRAVDLETGILASLSPDEEAIGYKKAALHLDSTNPSLIQRREERMIQA